jgi:general secretion pathway protein E
MELWTVSKVSFSRPSFSFAKRHGLLVHDLDNGRARVNCRPGFTALGLAELRRFLGLPLTLTHVQKDNFDLLLQTAYEGGVEDMELTGKLEDGLDDDLDLNSIALQLAEPEDLLESQDDAPIIRLINGLLTEAIKENASDIHIEPFEKILRVRFRVDGMLRDKLHPPQALAQLITSRIKVMAKLDIAEKRLPQDGRISLRLAGRPVDVRVSTMPCGHGERVVLRLLDKQAGRLDLEQLGMDQASLALMDRMIHRPHGILLVTGPTGSGKTTTLYAAISRLNEINRNIMTVEDPIEYFLNGISQTQVNSKVAMTFAKGLRAILRQDPDVVMVGEIRDLETAETAVQASLTGHLVLSTLHTNNAVSAVTRLRDMGVEPFLLSSSVVGVVAQRLVRLLCPHCKIPYAATPSECEEFGLSVANPPQLFKASGCEKCNSLGYHGRTSIYELVEVDEAMQSMIHDGMPEYELEAQARLKSPNIRQDGLRRILAGDTTIEEVIRVTRKDLAEV